MFRNALGSIGHSVHCLKLRGGTSLLGICQRIVGVGFQSKTGTSSAIGSVSTPRSVPSERFDCIATFYSYTCISALVVQGVY